MDEAKRVERMVELQIVEALRRAEFDRSSPAWRGFATALTEYGYAVLVAWGVTGALAVHAARHGGVSRTRVPSTLRLDEDESRALATEVLIVALEKFRTRSLATWSPAGGASLKTFFIGRCLMELADVYHAWDRRERRPYDVEQLIDDGRHGPRPDEEAEARVLTDHLLGEDPILRSAFELRGAGYGLGEIAKRLEMSRASVTSRMYRFRRGIQPGAEGVDG
jgi:DNA-directed RNA polymerase specialized sigma24 family protein